MIEHFAKEKREWWQVYRNAAHHLQWFAGFEDENTPTWLDAIKSNVRRYSRFKSKARAVTVMRTIQQIEGCPTCAGSGSVLLVHPTCITPDCGNYTRCPVGEPTRPLYCHACNRRYGARAVDVMAKISEQRDSSIVAKVETDSGAFTLLDQADDIETSTAEQVAARDDEARDAAREQYECEEIQIDRESEADDAKVSHGVNGSWVRGWLFVTL